MVALLDDKLKGSLSGFVGAELLRDHNVLVAFTEYNRNVIRLEPPLSAVASMWMSSSLRSMRCSAAASSASCAISSAARRRNRPLAAGF
jgi:acetylornithine/succinyldiaminopimelate/putrescine aminotransferase